jgi:ribose/xylose/arabinose/galactoside ABC-type transport system permease subunit
VLGRYVYAIGSNERTARLCGVRVERYKIICYTIAGATAGMAGVMMAATFVTAIPSEFRGAELDVIAAVVIGGTSLFGGEGTIAGSALGVLMLNTLYSGCNIVGISSYIQQIFIGGTIVLAAALDRFRHLRR